MLRFLKARALGCEPSSSAHPRTWVVIQAAPPPVGRIGGPLVSNTGYYGAAKDKHLPPHAFTETADQLALRWVREAEHGIDGTSIRPGS